MSDCLCVCVSKGDTPTDSYQSLVYDFMRQNRRHSMTIYKFVSELLNYEKVTKVRRERLTLKTY